MKRIVTVVVIAGLLLSLSAVGAAAASQGTNSANQTGIFGVVLDELEALARPHVTILPISGVARSHITIRVTHFPPNTELKIRLIQPNGNAVLVTHAFTDASGKLLKRLTIPNINESSEANESLRVEVTTMTGPRVTAMSKTFTFLESAEAREAATTTAATGLPNTGATKAPTVVVAHKSGTPSLQFTVTASNLPANTTLNIFLGAFPGELNMVGSAKTDSKGVLSNQVTIPSAQFNEGNEGQESWIVALSTTTGTNMLFLSRTFTPPEPEGPKG